MVNAFDDIHKDSAEAKQYLGRLVTGIAMGCLIFAWIIVIWGSVDDRMRQIQETRNEMTRINQVVTEQTRHSMSVVKLFMYLANDWINQHPTLDPRFTPEFAQMVDTFRRNMKGDIDVRLIGSSSELSFVSGLEGVPGIRLLNHIWVGDRDYVKAQRNPVTRGFFIGTPIKSRATGKMVLPISFPISQRIYDLNIISVTLDMSAFVAMYENARPQPDGQVQLFRTDGVLLVSNPGSVRLGESFAKDEIWRRFFASSVRGNAETSATGDQTRLASWLRMSDFPLVVTIARQPITGYIAWVRQFLVKIFLMLLFSAAVVMLLVYLFRILAAQAANQRKLEQIARTDTLTGLLNRSYFLYRAEEELGRSARYSRPICLAMLDLDHFKRINDSLGHEAGDAALRAFSQQILAVLRVSDLVGRVGGEEFMVIMPETGLEAAREISERLRLRVSGIATANGHLSVSIGLASWGGSGETLQQLMRRSDTAMYAAKRAGRNCVIVDSNPAGQSAPPPSDQSVS